MPKRIWAVGKEGETLFRYFHKQKPIRQYRGPRGGRRGKRKCGRNKVVRISKKGGFPQTNSLRGSAYLWAARTQLLLSCMTQRIWLWVCEALVRVSCLGRGISAPCVYLPKWSEPLYLRGHSRWDSGSSWRSLCAQGTQARGPRTLAPSTLASWLAKPKGDWLDKKKSKLVYRK